MTEKQKSPTEYKAGQIIIKQGDVGETAYVIEDGLVEILIERPDGQTHQVGTRGPGALIGEMAIVDHGTRTATVRAIHDCTLLEITHEDFSQRLDNADPILQMFTQVILTRYRDMVTRAETIGDSLEEPHIEALERTYTSKTDAVESIKIANELESAIKNDELDLHYQPIIDFDSGKICGFEALMRWTHPEKGFISPGVFIPIAEKSGLIIEASKWAVRRACRDLKHIGDETGLKDLYMSVNFSSADFSDPDFIDNIYKTLSETDVKASQLHLEITERLLIQQPDTAKDVLNMCRKAGMQVAIDDFGTGYSSLSYLYYFPIDTLKIDQSFVRVMTQEAASMELVKSIIGLGKNMNMSVVAEGVEELAEARILHSLGCDKAQGYYFARPVPLEEVIKLTGNWEPLKLSA